MRVLALIGGIGVLVVSVCMSTSLAVFINPPSVFIVIAGALLFTLAGHSGKDLRAALRAAFSHHALTREDAARHAAVLQTLRVTLKGAGWVGFLIGLVVIFGSLETLLAPSLMPAMSVALLTVLYGHVLGELVVAPKIGSVLARAEAQTQP